MNSSEFVERAATFITKEASPSLDDANAFPFLYCSLALAGETGEFVEKVKKMLRDDPELFTASRLEQLTAELGDVLWAVGSLCFLLGVPLEELMKRSIGKLDSRRLRNVLHGEGDNR